ncbi:hypothetical protein L218DRAFT_886025 [Marasmius fiardii PR-910]|nr:hypothetical protein L218DRAFT_886025 [Marasmius fiardii PR-910]
MTKTIKESENANARPSRVTTRSKAGLGNAATGLGGTKSDGHPPTTTNRLAATTASSRAKAVDSLPEKTTTVGKRKREILAEVTEVNKGKAKAGGVSGKGKEKAESTGTSSKLKPDVRPKATGSSAKGTGTRSALRKTVATSTSGTRSTRRTIQPLSDVVVDDVSTAKSSEPVFHFVPRNEDDATIPLPSIPEDDTDRPRVFKKRHTESKETPPVVEKPVVAEPPSSLDVLCYEEEYVATELAMVDDEDDTGMWDDLDTEDMDDPLMAAEYINEIVFYLKEREQKVLPTDGYIKQHRELGWDARELAFDWISAVHARFGFLPESYFLFVNIFDRFLSLRTSVPLTKLQLVAVSAFCIAVKYEEGVSPSLQELVKLTEDAYTAEEICKAERYILKTIGYDLSFPGPMTWLRRGSKADLLEPKARTIAKYLLEAASFDRHLVAVPPSLQAAASLWFARLMLHREDWSESLYRKYASKKYYKCSVFVRKWALDFGREGAQVDLAAALPAIKVNIMEQRVAKLAAEECYSD